MTTIQFDHDHIPIDCKVSGIAAERSQGSECCEGVFQYQPMVIDVGEDKVATAKLILTSTTIAAKIETQFQTIWLLGITKREMMGAGKVAIYFDNCVIM